MKEMVYKQDAIDALWKAEKELPYYDSAQVAVNVIKDLPPAEPEIIHCRECKHWREGVAYSYCNKLFGMGVLDVYDYRASEDDFCSMAERREE